MQIVPDDSGRVNEEIDLYFTTYQVRTVVVVTRSMTAVVESQMTDMLYKCSKMAGYLCL